MAKALVVEVGTPSNEGETSSKLVAANEILKRNLTYSVGAGLLPIPFADLAGIAGCQLKMLNELSKLYGVRFSEHKVKNILAALIGSVGTAALATGALGSLIKMIPVVGSVSGALALPIVAGSSTFAVGKVFIQHFESGGTFLDFNPAKTKAYFNEQFRQGNSVAATAAEGAPK